MMIYTNFNKMQLPSNIVCLTILASKGENVLRKQQIHIWLLLLAPSVFGWEKQSLRRRDPLHQVTPSLHFPWRGLGRESACKIFVDRNLPQTLAWWFEGCHLECNGFLCRLEQKGACKE